MSNISKFIIPGLVLGSSLFADNGCNPPPACPPKPKPKPQECCPSKCSQMSHQRGPHREITPNAGPCVADGADMFVTADFIYWTAHEDNLGFAFTDGTTAVGAASTSPAGTVAHPRTKFKPGFKVGVGVDFDHDGWDLYANYTWFKSGKSKRTLSSSAGLTLGTEQFALTGATFTSAKGDWQLKHFNVIDLELGRNFYISRYLMLRPFAGMKGTWQKQLFDADFFGTAAGMGVTVDEDQVSKTWGIGMRIGLDTSWHFTKSFSMLGNLAVNGLWEQFKTSRKTLESLSNGTFAVLHHLKSHYHSVKPVLEWQLGLRWETWFCDDSYHFSIEGAWEMQWWGDQNAFLTTDNNRLKLGDLGLQGFTLHLRFDF